MAIYIYCIYYNGCFLMLFEVPRCLCWSPGDLHEMNNICGSDARHVTSRSEGRGLDVSNGDSARFGKRSRCLSQGSINSADCDSGYTQIHTLDILWYIICDLSYFIAIYGITLLCTTYMTLHYIHYIVLHCITSPWPYTIFDCIVLQSTIWYQNMTFYILLCHN